MFLCLLFFVLFLFEKTPEFMRLILWRNKTTCNVFASPNETQAFLIDKVKVKWGFTGAISRDDLSKAVKF